MLLWSKAKTHLSTKNKVRDHSLEYQTSKPETWDQEEGVEGSISLVVKCCLF